MKFDEQSEIADQTLQESQILLRYFFHKITQRQFNFLKILILKVQLKNKY